MSNSTSVHSNAFNFMSFILSQVDPRTGQYTCAISLPELKANNLCGPIVPLQLNFNPLNAPDSGFGKGWNLQLSQFNPTNRVLSLYTGETFRVDPGANGVEIPEKKIDSFHFHDLGNRRYRVEHKSGLVEILQVGQGQIALPVQMLSPQGHSVSLDYVAFGTEPLLSSIRNADRSQLLSLVRTTNQLTLTLHPGSAHEAVFQVNLLGGETCSLNRSSDNVGVTGYEILRDDQVIDTTKDSTPAYLAIGLIAGITYRFSVQAIDAAGNRSQTSASISVKTAPIGPPRNVRPSATRTRIDLAWDRPEDAIGLLGYRIEADDFNGSYRKVETPAQSVALTLLKPSTEYTVSISAHDASQFYGEPLTFKVTTAS